MSSPFDSAFTQRVDKVSTALNEGNASEAAHQLRGMVEDDPLQAMRLIRNAERISSSGAIDNITRDCAGDIYIVNRASGQSTFAGRLGSHGQAPEQPLDMPPGYAGDQTTIQSIKNGNNEWQTPGYTCDQTTIQSIKNGNNEWQTPGYAGDQTTIQSIKSGNNEWQTLYPAKEWHHYRIAPRYQAPEYELPPDCVFNGYPRPYYGYPENRRDLGWRYRRLP